MRPAPPPATRPSRLRALWPLLLLAACAQPGPVPPQKAWALVDGAWTDWQRWGRQEVRVSAGDRVCAVLPDGRCVTIDDGCGKEQDPQLCPIVNDYWDAVNPSPSAPHHRCTQRMHCEAHWDPAWGAPDDTPPWSAAFITALMRRAGFTRRDFAFSDTHADYLVAARDGRTGAYTVVPTPATAAPGDLICATRRVSAEDRPPTTLAAIRDGAQATPMHCDLVVARDPDGRHLDAIGGNVEQAVSLSRVELDAQGRVSPTVNTARPWIAVMRLRRRGAD